MQRFLAFLMICVTCSYAAFMDIDLKDSRLQSDNTIFLSGGILGFAAEFGVFDEPQNLIDYTLSVGVQRFGYSHSNGDVSVSFWNFYIKPFIWSVAIKNVVFEVNSGIGYIFTTNNLNHEFNHVFRDDFKNSGTWTIVSKHLVWLYGYRLGYRIMDRFVISLVANYQKYFSAWYKDCCRNEHRGFLMGGWGVNFQWNIPWIPF